MPRENETVWQRQTHYKNASQLPSKLCRRFGIVLQMLLFILNGTAWVIAVLAIIGGLIIGFSSQTISIYFEWSDLIVTTPATIFIMYGFALLVVTGVGCFAASSGHFRQNVCYCILIIFFVIFDAVPGILLLLSRTSLIDFLEHLRRSMDGYNQAHPSYVGIIPVHPNFYWDHFQTRGKCCGLYNYDDWRNSTIGRTEKSIPDTCCNEEYEHRYCGEKVFQHPDVKDHGIKDMIHTEGCLSIFPPTLIQHFEEVTIMGLLLGALLIMCFFVAIAIIVVIRCHMYDPGQGPDNYHLEEVEKNVSALHLAAGDYKEGVTRRNLSKVYPAKEDGDTGEYREQKRVNFKESGPLYIPSSETWDDEDYPPLPSSKPPTANRKSKN